MAHGGLANEYLAAVEHVFGQQSYMCAVPISANCDRDLQQQEICAAADRVDQGQGVVIVTDVFGATPMNLSKSACNCSSRKMINGANVPLLLKLVQLRAQPIENAVEKAMEAGRKHINCLSS